MIETEIQKNIRENEEMFGEDPGSMKDILEVVTYTVAVIVIVSFVLMLVHVSRLFL